QTDHAAAMKLERRLRRTLESACAEQPLLTVDFSAGLALLRPDDATLTHLMVRADNGLYQAKNQGRGRLCAMD
ncbi:MAG: diguanylate cyclase, partial [Rhodoferax sp.]